MLSQKHDAYGMTRPKRTRQFLGCLAGQDRGRVIHKVVKDAVRDDPALEGLYTTRSGEFGPDFSDPATGRWWDVTTPEQWPAHEAKYNDPFGQGTQLPTRPPRP